MSNYSGEIYMTILSVEFLIAIASLAIGIISLAVGIISLRCQLKSRN